MAEASSADRCTSVLQSRSTRDWYTRASRQCRTDSRRVNDAEHLRHDPAMRWIVGGKAAQGHAASPSQMGRFETQWLIPSRGIPSKLWRRSFRDCRHGASRYQMARRSRKACT
jgi:hypothetical protein